MPASQNVLVFLFSVSTASTASCREVFSGLWKDMDRKSNAGGGEGGDFDAWRSDLRYH